MDQLQQYLRGLEKGKFHTHTNNTLKLKQSMLLLLTYIIDLKHDRVEIV